MGILCTYAKTLKTQLIAWVTDKSANALFNHHSVVKWKPNTKKILYNYKTNHQASISALSPVL